MARAKPSPTNCSGVYSRAEVDTAIAWVRGRIILAEDLFNEFNSHKNEMIIAHERAHIQRGDVLYFIGLALVDAL